MCQHIRAGAAGRAGWTRGALLIGVSRPQMARPVAGTAARMKNGHAKAEGQSRRSGVRRAGGAEGEVTGSRMHNQWAQN